VEVIEGILQLGNWVGGWDLGAWLGRGRVVVGRGLV
jgi:hypothetical protein